MGHCRPSHETYARTAPIRETKDRYQYQCACAFVQKNQGKQVGAAGTLWVATKRFEQRPFGQSQFRVGRH